MSQPAFGIVPAGLPMIVQPTESPSPTSFLFAIQATRPFEHMAVFLLPGMTLPPNTLAAIYFVTPPGPAQAAPNSTFAGGVGEGKESAIFKIPAAVAAAVSSGNVVVGIGIEDSASVLGRIAELDAAKAARAASSTSVVPARGGGAAQGQQPNTLVLAQRIIKNAFDFLASFAGEAGGVEVVPLKAFQEWWRKFESKVRNDPSFLEKDN